MKKFAMLLLCLLAAPCFAINGTELQNLLISPSPSENLQAMRYIQAIVDAEKFHMAYENARAKAQMRPSDKPRFFCMPPNTTLGQTKDLVAAFLRTTPAAPNMSAAQLTHMALQAQWPCKE